MSFCSYYLEKRVLHFKQPAGTSRGVYLTRKIWLIELTDGERQGVGECAPLPDLSCDAMSDEQYASILNKVCEDFCKTGEIDYDFLRDYPSMLFGLETAWLNLQKGEKLFDTAFARGEVGIPINGLVWMGNYEEMLARLEEKLEKGFRCVKLKIGAIDFDKELDLVKRIRERFSFHEVELRVDANGGFKYEEALYKLELLSQYAIHSIEQPIKQGQWSYMAELCRESPLPIALDEELIGVNDPETKRHLLNIIKPRYIILKPSLHGGMMGCREWISIAKDMGIGSWITGDHITMPQGLGTGQLFTDNIPMGLTIQGDKLFLDKKG